MDHPKLLGEPAAARSDWKTDLIELVRTNDIVLISLIESLLRQAEIEHIVLDQHTSILEGSIGAIQMRIMVIKEEANAARRLMKEADLGEYLKSDDRSGNEQN